MFRMSMAVGAACIVGVLAGCTAADGDSLSKEEAQRLGGKGDGVDFCAIFQWYEDGTCDRWCPRWDDDCGSQPGAGCDAQEAYGQGICLAYFGVKWNGEHCVSISGCSCVGADCGDLYVEPSECRTAHSECASETACGGWLGATCNASEYCHYNPSDGCGRADHTGVCRARPAACASYVDPVCGCDGETYQNLCHANMAGTSIFQHGACGPACETAADCAQPICHPGGPCPRVTCDEGECVQHQEPLGCSTDDDCPISFCLPRQPCSPLACVEGECVLRVDNSCETTDDCAQPLCSPGGPCPSVSCIDGECIQE